MDGEQADGSAGMAGVMDRIVQRRMAGGRCNGIVLHQAGSCRVGKW